MTSTANVHYLPCDEDPAEQSRPPISTGMSTNLHVNPDTIITARTFTSAYREAVVAEFTDPVSRSTVAVFLGHADLIRLIDALRDQYRKAGS